MNQTFGRVIRNSPYSRPHPAAQNLRHTPCLRNTTPLRIRLLSVENLAERTDGAGFHIRFKAGKESPRPFYIIGMHLQPRIDERSDDPTPNCSLMINGISRAQVAV